MDRSAPRAASIATTSLLIRNPVERCGIAAGGPPPPTAGRGDADPPEAKRSIRSSYQEAAQLTLEQDPDDPNGLDPDGDWVACEGESFGDADDGGSDDDEGSPLDARLGGTRESWEDEYGDPIESPTAVPKSTAYDLDGYSSVQVGFHEERVTSVSLFAPRREGEAWSEAPHGMDWTVQKAHQLARRFLPTDAELGAPQDEAGYVGRTCASEALAAEVPEATYDFVDNTPVYGGCSYALFLNAEGRVGWIAIDLVVEDATEPEAEPGVVTDVPAVEADSQGETTADERAYIQEIVDQTDTMSESFERFTELVGSPQIGTDEWTFDVAAQLVTWRATYEEAQAMEVPPAFAEIHTVYLEGLGYYDAASYDIATGLDTFDVSLLNQAAVSLQHGNERIQEAKRLLDVLREERGL